MVLQIIGRPTDAQRVIEQLGKERRRSRHPPPKTYIEQFVAEQAAAETADITPLLPKLARRQAKQLE